MPVKNAELGKLLLKQYKLAEALKQVNKDIKKLTKEESGQLQLDIKIKNA